eukprot:705820-Prorocentrum_minimum.AAC.2
MWEPIERLPGSERHIADFNRRHAAKSAAPDKREATKVSDRDIAALVKPDRPTEGGFVSFQPLSIDCLRRLSLVGGSVLRCLSSIDVGDVRLATWKVLDRFPLVSASVILRRRVASFSSSMRRAQIILQFIQLAAGTPGDPSRSEWGDPQTTNATQG